MAIDKNDWIKKVLHGTEYGLLSRLQFCGVDDKGFLNDGVHPNVKAFKIVKPLDEAAIATALKKKQGAK